MLLFQCDVCLFFVAVLNWHWYLLLEAQRTISYRNGFAMDWSNHFLFFVLRAAPEQNHIFFITFMCIACHIFCLKKRKYFFCLNFKYQHQSAFPVRYFRLWRTIRASRAVRSLLFCNSGSHLVRRPLSRRRPLSFRGCRWKIFHRLLCCTG